MVVFHKLCRIAPSSQVHKTESVSVTLTRFCTLCVSDGARTVSGSVFHSVGPETVKLR